MVDSMKWQLICFSCSVNQFITKRKHKHTHTVQSFPLWYPRSRRTLRSFHSELTDKLRNQQLHTSSTCLWRFPMSDMERTHTRAHAHIHLAYHQFAHWQQLENKQQPVATTTTTDNSSGSSSSSSSTKSIRNVGPLMAAPHWHDGANG